MQYGGWVLFDTLNTEYIEMANMMLPGNPRYQPKDLMDWFGYDNLVRTQIEVEIAAMRTLADMGIISREDIALLTSEKEAELYAITTTQVDKIEREITKHDIRALVYAMQAILPLPLRRWVHVPLTSYDVIDTARSIQYVRSFKFTLEPKITQVIRGFQKRALEHADLVQIGRTHGQHALPITVGFWFATVLNRILYNAIQMGSHAHEIVGKVSGAVGAYNAQKELGIDGRLGVRFEDKVLERLDLVPASISTQILPPEPLAYYLHSAVMLSAALGQFGRDGRNLMRTEIAELAEPFEKGQVGSSTMAHKRNPLHFENLEGMWWRTKNEYGKVLDTLISEHQRDLVGSSIARDFPIIIVNLVQQLDTLLRPGKDDPRPFIERIVVDTDSCGRNLGMKGDTTLAEPLYLLLQMHGYDRDAHHLINHQAMPMVEPGTRTLVQVVENLAVLDASLSATWQRVPEDMKQMLRDPARYTGRAAEKVRQICEMVDDRY